MIVYNPFIWFLFMPDLGTMTLLTQSRKT
jgi:hypothetical protein